MSNGALTIEYRKRRLKRHALKEALHHIDCLIAVSTDPKSHTVKAAKQYMREIKKWNIK